ncbi:hypothetical protein ATHL_02055 [Anaerolinea thermolimosa]|nr:hypothetical protein ATHL_02055 [Anaerolinea thermolimosa]
MSVTLEVILGIAAFVLFFILWVIVPTRIHKKHPEEEEL